MDDAQNPNNPPNNPGTPSVPPPVNPVGTAPDWPTPTVAPDPLIGATPNPTIPPNPLPITPPVSQPTPAPAPSLPENPPAPPVAIPDIAPAPPDWSSAPPPAAPTDNFTPPNTVPEPQTWPSSPFPSEPMPAPPTPNPVDQTIGSDPFNWSATAAGTPAAVPGIPGLDQNLPHQEPTEPAPTDLSQLSSLGTENNGTYTPPVSTPETLVVPQSSAIPEQLSPEVSTKKFPRALLIGGIVILLLVIAGSAYFILGIGKSQTPAPASLPAQQAPLTNPPKPVTQTTPAPSSATPATGSATFGGTTSSSTTGQSAIDILKARQATASASPTSH